MVYETRFQPCPYRNANHQCVNKKVKGKCCGYLQVKNCDIYIEWAKGKKMDSDCVETSEVLNLQRSEND